MDARLLSFRKLYKFVSQSDKLDITSTSLMFSALIYFSDEFIYKIGTELAVEELSINETHGIKFMYAKYRGHYFVAFRGTEPSLWSNWKRILNFIPKKSAGGRMAHRGFVMAFADCKKLLDTLLSESKSVIFTGHSLGGALALLATEYYGGAAVAFASPKVYFNEKVRNEVYIGYRIVGDLIPHVPLSFFFLEWSRTKPEFWHHSPKRYWNPLEYHHMSTYITVLMGKLYGSYQS